MLLIRVGAGYPPLADDDSESDGDTVFDELRVGEEEDIGVLPYVWREGRVEGFSGCILSRYKYVKCCTLKRKIGSLRLLVLQTVAELPG